MAGPGKHGDRAPWLQENHSRQEEHRVWPGSGNHLRCCLIASNIVTVMAVNTQFAIAVHIMTALAYSRERDVTSTFLAGSVNTSPSFVRRVLAKLSRVGLVETATGKNGACWLARRPRDISLLEIYQAVGAPKVFAIHGYDPRRTCLVSCNIKSALEGVLSRTQTSMEKSLDKMTLADVLSDLQKK
jgi:Rrf2 family protein